MVSTQDDLSPSRSEWRPIGRAFRVTQRSLSSYFSLCAALTTHKNENRLTLWKMLRTTGTVLEMGLDKYDAHLGLTERARRQSQTESKEKTTDYDGYRDRNTSMTQR